MKSYVLNRKESLCLMGILALAFLLRNANLLSFSFYGDEWYTLQSARDLGHTWMAFPYFLLIRGILEVFGLSVIVLREISVLLGMAGVLASFYLGLQFRNARTGLIVAFLAATSPFLIPDSQEARYYSLYFLMTVASLIFFLKYILQPSRTKCWSWLIISLAGIAMHYLVLILFLGELIYLMIKSLKNHPTRALPIAVILPVTAGIFLIFREPLYHTLLWTGFHQELFTGMRGFTFSTLFKLPFTLFSFIFGYNVNPFWFWLTLPGLLFSAAIFLTGLLRNRSPLGLAFWITVFALPLLLVFLLVEPLSPPGTTNLMPKHALFAFPLWSLGIALGLETAKKMPLKILAWGLFFFVTFSSLSAFYFPRYAYYRYRYVNHRQPADLIQRLKFKNPIFVIDGHTRNSFLLYSGHLMDRYPQTDFWQFQKLTEAALEKFSEVIIITDHWKAFNPNGQAQTKESHEIYQKTFRRIQSKFILSDGFVDYPLFVYVFEKKEAASITFPVFPYGFAYADFKLPQPAGPSRTPILGSTSVDPRNPKLQFVLPAQIASDPKPLELILNLEASQDIPSHTKVGMVVLENSRGEKNVFELVKNENIFDAFTRLWADRVSIPQEKIALTWQKKPLLSGGNRYPGSFYDFPAFLYRLPLKWEGTAPPEKGTVNYLPESGSLRIWKAREKS